LGEEGQGAQQGDDGQQGRAPGAIQAQLPVGREVLLVAVATVVVGAAVADGTVDGLDVVAAVFDEAGVVSAEGADGA
jgi:hypothetical protein